MRARTKARKRALDILFESEARGEDPLDGARPAAGDRRRAAGLGLRRACWCEGVVAHRERIDQLLAEHAEGWTVARMPAVDRTLLRIGVLRAAVGRTRSTTRWRSPRPSSWRARLSTDDCPRFVNGVLGRIADIAEHLRATR